MEGRGERGRADFTYLFSSAGCMSEFCFAVRAEGVRRRIFGGAENNKIKMLSRSSGREMM
jgi:hypothetical protein